MSYEKQTWESGDVIEAAKLNHVEEGVRSVNGNYTEQEWATGDLITAERLNHIEDGIANAGGGGSSDWSIAEVTFYTNRQSTFKIAVPTIYNEELLSCIDSSWFDGEVQYVPLYKGSCEASLIVEDNTWLPVVTSTGDIQVGTGIIDREKWIIIRGNGTVTIA